MTSGRLRPPERLVTYRRRCLKVALALSAKLPLTTRAAPEGVAHKFTTARCRRDRHYGFIDLQLKSAVKLPQAFKHTFARTGIGYVTAVRVAHEPLTTLLQLAIRLTRRGHQDIATEPAEKPLQIHSEHNTMHTTAVITRMVIVA